MSTVNIHRPKYTGQGLGWWADHEFRRPAPCCYPPPLAAERDEVGTRCLPSSPSHAPGQAPYTPQPVPSGLAPLPAPSLHLWP